MNESLSRTAWPFPDLERLEGKYVRITLLNPDNDVDDLYEVSHAREEYKSLWKYMHAGPFSDKNSMHSWLSERNRREGDRFYSVLSKDMQKKVGMFGIMNISTIDGRAELGTIWYSPMVQKTRVNTEVTYLFLRYLFNDLKYRRIEWKCDDQNESSKRTASRMGFSYEGLFRQHMAVKGRNGNTVWFAMIDSEWPERKANFEQFLTGENVSLTQLNSSLLSPEHK